MRRFACRENSIFILGKKGDVLEIVTENKAARKARNVGQARKAKGRLSGLSRKKIKAREKRDMWDRRERKATAKDKSEAAAKKE